MKYLIKKTRGNIIGKTFHKIDRDQVSREVWSRVMHRTSNEEGYRVRFNIYDQIVYNIRFKVDNLIYKYENLE